MTEHALIAKAETTAMPAFSDMTRSSSEEYGAEPDECKFQVANWICQANSKLVQLLDKVEDFASGAIDLDHDILQWNGVKFSDPFHDDWAFWKSGDLPEL